VIVWCAFVLGLFFAILILFYFWQDKHLAVRLVYAALLVALGVIAGRLIALRHASREHQKLFQLLYQSADPDRFIREYQPLPGRCKPDSAEYVMTTNYLSSGYAAKGDFAKAVSLLLSLEPEQLKFHQLGASALTQNNLCQYYLWMGDVEKAREQLQILEALAEETKSRMPSVSKNLSSNLRLYQEHLHFLEEQPADAEYIREEVGFSANLLHRANMQLLLARVLLRQGDAAGAKELLEPLAEKYARLFAGAQAKKILSEL